MKSIEINGSLRAETGKKATRELRKNDSVPCVLYGINKDENGNQVATHFTVTNDGLRKLVYTPHIYVVDLNIDGKINCHHERYPVPPCNRQDSSC